MSLADMDRRFLLAGALAAVLILISVTWLWMSRSDESAIPAEDLMSTPGTDETGTPDGDEAGTVPTRTVELFFPGDDRRLHALARELPESPDPVENIERVVEALLAGPHGEFAARDVEESAAPKSGDQAGQAAPTPLGLPDINPKDGLWPPLPAAVGLGRAYFIDDTVIVDLISKDDAVPMVGARGEILMLYSLVNTVLLNTEEAQRLVLLWNGQQRSTFAGHFDTTRPLTPKSGLIAR